MQSAQVLAGYYFLAGNETLRQEQKTDDPANDWEEQFLDFLEVQQSDLPAGYRLTHGMCVGNSVGLSVVQCQQEIDVAHVSGVSAIQAAVYSFKVLVITRLG